MKPQTSLANDRQWYAVWRLNGKLLIRISFFLLARHLIFQHRIASNVRGIFYNFFVLNHNSLIIRQRIRNEFEIFFNSDRVIKHCTTAKGKWEKDQGKWHGSVWEWVWNWFLKIFKWFFMLGKYKIFFEKIYQNLLRKIEGSNPKFRTFRNFFFSYRLEFKFFFYIYFLNSINI